MVPCGKYRLGMVSPDNLKFKLHKNVLVDSLSIYNFLEDSSNLGRNQYSRTLKSKRC